MDKTSRTRSTSSRACARARLAVDARLVKVEMYGQQMPSTVRDGQRTKPLVLIVTPFRQRPDQVVEKAILKRALVSSRARRARSFACRCADERAAPQGAREGSCTATP